MPPASARRSADTATGWASYTPTKPSSSTRWGGDEVIGEREWLVRSVEGGEEIVVALRVTGRTVGTLGVRGRSFASTRDAAAGGRGKAPRHDGHPERSEGADLHGGLGDAGLVGINLRKPGNELQTPMAIVIVGGLLSATALNMVVLPALYWLAGPRAAAARRGAGD